MLRGIRKASANWLGRIVMGVVMGLLAAVFALWGINDIFRNFGRSSLASVGGIEIPVEVYRQTFNDRVHRFGAQIGRPLTPDEAKAMGLDRQVLLELIANASLDQRARQMRLGVPDAEILRHTMEEPAFHGPTGKFDRARFEYILHQNGFTEQRFVDEQRRIILRKQIIDTLAGELPVPKAWLDAINQFQNQERSIEYVMLGAAQAGDPPQPTAEELTKYFEAHKFLFRAPEYRKIEVVAVTPAELGKWMEISDADVKAWFDEHRSHYLRPERRHIEQIVFPNMAAAEAAAARIKDGLSFSALAAERGLSDKDIDLGTLAKSDVADPAVGNAAFALKVGEVSAPVQGRFGPAIVTVLGIEPEETKPFAEIVPLVRNDIATERAKPDVKRLHEQIEDERAGGATLAQAAEKLKLPIVTYNVDRTGREPSGKVASLPAASQVIAAAFNSDIGVDNDPVDADGGYVWYNVAAITQGRDRTLDEVKDQVEARWREDEIASRLKAKSAELVDKLKAGMPFDSIAGAAGLKLQTADKLRRGKHEGDVSRRVVAAVFQTAKDAFGSAQGDTPSDWVVFRVTGVGTPALDANSPEFKRIGETVKNQEGKEIYEQYVARLEQELGTSVNQAALAQALGNGAPDTN
jgi:peptidyl-prolyl cis-trans isomerase D